MDQPSISKDRIFTKEYILVTGIYFLISLNFMALLTTTSYYVLDVYNVSNSAAGLATGIFVIGSVVSRLFAGRYALAVGYKRMLLIGIAGMAIASAFYFIADSFASFCVVRLVNGLAFGIATNTGFTIVSSIIPKSRSGEGMGYFSLSSIVAVAVGPLLAVRLMQEIGMDSVFMLATLAPAVGAVLAIFLKLKPQPPMESGNDAKKIGLLDQFFERKILPIAALCFVMYIGNGSITGFMAVHGERLGYVNEASMVFLATAICIIATRPFVSRLFDRKGANIVIYPGIVIFTISMFFYGFSTQGWMLILGGALTGIGLGAIQAGTMALVVKLVTKERLPVGNSTYFLSLDTAMAVGPIIAGSISSGIGLSSMYIVMGIIMACGIPLYYTVFARNTRVSQFSKTKSGT